ncbi:MAG: proteasome-type protease [Synechococcales cyanobacterium]
MTYCLGLMVETGLILMTDSRTNAGIDNISTYRKLFDFGVEGERTLIILTSGNLSASQAILSLIEEDIKLDEGEHLLNLPTLFAVARYLGHKNRVIAGWDRPSLEGSNISFSSRMIVGGQIRGEAPSLYLIYTEGNFIRATPETPFLQLGETKYGKTILDRAFRFDSSLEDAARCAVISMDAAMRSNLSVGPPLELVMYRQDDFCIRQRCRFQEQDPFLRETRQQWEQALQALIPSMPPVPWQEEGLLPPPPKPTPRRRKAVNTLKKR